jgi:RNA polymerase-binding transcription factor DksA
MAEKKTTSKTAPAAGKAKPAAKGSKPSAKATKPAPVTKKPVAKASKSVSVKKTAPAKKAAPAKKPVAVAKKPVPAKKAVPAKKPAPAKKAVPAKKAAPAKKTAPAGKPVPAAKPASPKKPVPVPAKKSEPLKKAAAPAPEKKPAAPVKAEPAAKHAKPAAKPASSKPRSSLVDFPVPPAPVKPPFVPPKSTSAPSGEAVAAGSNGSHSPAFVQKQRQRLLDLRDELVDAMSGMTRDTIRNAPEGSEASGSGQHQGDAGSDAYDRDFALSVLAKEQDALYEIEQALRRIQTGSYGICEISSRKIPQARLEAIPFARLTVECQAQWEKEYGKRRFRPSNEVGFSGGNYIEDEDSETVSLDDDED